MCEGKPGHASYGTMAVWIHNIFILTFSIKIIKTDVSAKFEGSKLFLVFTTVKTPVFIWFEN